MPVAIKDLTDTAGLVTTYGSALYRTHIPIEDDLVVARLRAAGAVIVGKTMTPEFGFGAICANALRAPTCNPWNPTLTSGGSSGGAAVAVATGMVPLAHGTDFGGSVRTPASFCGVLSLRPTPGLIPSPKRGLAFDTLATHGVLARSVEDLALFIDAVAGPDPRDPTSLRWPHDTGSPSAALSRIAATEDFGAAPVSSDARQAMRAAADTISRTLAPVQWMHPDCSGAIETFHTLRQPLIRHNYGHLLQSTATTCRRPCDGRSARAGRSARPTTSRLKRSDPICITASRRFSRHTTSLWPPPPPSFPGPMPCRTSPRSMANHWRP